jgi:hypothetical protein
VLLERAPIHVLDAGTDPEYRMVEMQKIGGYHSVLGVPLLEAALQVLPPQLAQGPDFLASEGVRAIDAVLGPPYMDAAALKLDHIPGQSAEFAGA